MTTSMTRKGLGVVLASGLAVAGLAAPANAAISFTTAPLSESGTGALLNSDFLIATTVADAPASAGTKIKYLVEGVDATSDLRTSQFDVTSTIADISAYDYRSTGLAATGTALNANDEIIIGASGTPIQPTTANPYIVLSVGLDVAEVDEETTITVTPFTDGNDDDVFDSNLGEVMGSPISITFYPTDEVSITGTQSISVASNEVTITADIAEVNEASSLAGGLSQLVATETLVNGTSTTDTLSDEEYDEVRDILRVVHSTGTINAADVVVTKMFVGDETTESATLRNNLGSTNAAAFVVSDHSADDEASDENNTIWAPISTNPFFLAKNGGTTEDVVRVGDGTLQVVVYVDGTDNTGGDPEAGETVTFTVKEGNATAFDSDVSITAGGKTLTDSSSSVDEITVDVVTDADGKAVLDLTYANLDNTNTFVIDADVEAAGISASERTFTAINSEDLTVSVTNTNESSDDLVFAKGGTVSLDLAVRDSFGLVPAGTHRVQYWINWGTSGASLDKVDFAVFDSNGNATVTETAPDVVQTAVVKLLDIEAADGSDVSGEQIDSQDKDGDYGVYSDATLEGPGASSAQVDLKIVATVNAVSSVDFVTGESHEDDGTDVAIADSSLYSLDTRTAGTNELDAGTTGRAFATVNDRQDSLVALATDINGVALQNKPVTFSANGFEFTDEAGEVQATDSLTVYTDEDGKAKVTFRTNTAGDHVVTITSGGQSDTLDVTIATPADETKLASWSVSPSSSTVDPGSTLNFVATALDKWGNALDLSGTPNATGVTVSYDGPGIVIPNDYSSITKTNSDGEVKIAIAFGSNDSGSHSITVSGDLGTADKTDDVAATYSFTIGGDTFTGTYGTMSAWTVDQGDGTAKVYVKFPTIGEKVRIGHQTGGSGSYETIYVKTTTSETMDGLRQVAGVGTYVVRTIDLESGTNRIRVTVGDSTEVQVRYNE